MEHFLIFSSLMLVFIMLMLFINEKTLKIPNEIFLLGTSLIIGLALLILRHLGANIEMWIAFDIIDKFRIDKVLMNVLLCFMLFSGASELKLKDLNKNKLPIMLLALGTTLISSAIFGLIIWGAFVLIGVRVDYTLCILIGAIVSPTDPIAATGILNKLGLSEDIIATIEGESLFNDGTGVALFIFLKDLICKTSKSNFFVIMSRELGGAIIIGFAVSFLFFLIMRRTKDPVKLIIISLAAVTTCYSVCDILRCSGVIASVICGIYFQTAKDKWQLREKGIDPEHWYTEFWHVVDNIFNYTLYSLIGISLVYLDVNILAIFIGLVAIVGNLVARYIGVYLSSILVKHNPGEFDNKRFTLLLTFGGLKGGLCLALALSTSAFVGNEILSYIIASAFAIVISTTLVQGLTVSKVYEKIKDTSKI